MKINTNKVYRIINPNPTRTYLAITNMSNSIAYLRIDEAAQEEFEDNGFPLDNYGVLEIQGIDCYKGGFYVVADTDATDIRVLEL